MKHGAFYYVHPGSGKWERIGTGLAEAKRRGNLYNDPAVRANREKACLSAAFTWMMRRPETGLSSNPCFGIATNPEQKRDRYVDHDEYALIYGQASKPERILMELIYRTLQRPEDIITWTVANLVNKREADGSIQRVVRNRQAKTGQVVDIRVTPQIEAILASATPTDAVLGPGLHLVRTRKGEAYTYDGISAMLRRRVYKAVKEGKLAEPFGFYDLKGKGATDMWLAHVPLTEIQVLCGHESVRTTEIYVKARWRGTVSPNKTALPAV